MLKYEDDKTAVTVETKCPERFSRPQVKTSADGLASAAGKPAAHQYQRDCPPSKQLRLAATGELPSEHVRQHLTKCEACRERMLELCCEIEDTRGRLTNRHDGDNCCAVEHAPTTSVGDAPGFSLSQSAEDDHPNEAPNEPARSIAMIGRYYVLETICESGQATVYCGLHPSLLISVVIKLSHSTWKQDEHGRAQLVSEAKALAEIVHPHLARLYDLDFFEDRPFLVLEYVRGQHLGHYRESADLQPSEIAFLVAKVARAVSAAHQRGILHLDLKPENVLVTPDGEPVLIDFGLCFLSTSSQAFRSEEEGCIAGTPQYMAPEQMRSGRDGLTPRTDVFGLGGLLYYLCVGRDPFTVTRVNGRLHRSEEPEWDALWRADVPTRLKSICHKALSADPDSRYSNAEVLAEKLEAVGRKWSRPAGMRLRRTACLMLLVGIAGLVASRIVPAPTQSYSSALTLHVARDGREVPLPSALPLRKADQICLEGVAPLSTDVALVAKTDTGVPQRLRPVDLDTKRSAVRATFPGFHNAAPIISDSGILIVLLVSHEEPSEDWPDTEELGRVLRAMPSFGNNVIVSFNRRNHEVLAGPGPRPARAQLGVLDAEIRSLQTRLAAKFDDFAGIYVGANP